MAKKIAKKPRPKLRKATDDAMTIRSASGKAGLIREEVWVNSKGEVVRYNLAYINFSLCQADNGRVLGYDNAHGFHERHSCGVAEKVGFTTYEVKANEFYEEVARLKEKP